MTVALTNKLYINDTEIKLPAEVRNYQEFNGSVMLFSPEILARGIYMPTMDLEHLEWVVDPVPFQTAPPGYSMIAVENGILLAVSKGTYILDESSGKILKEINEYK